VDRSVLWVISSLDAWASWLLLEWGQRLAVVFELHDSLGELWDVEVNLQNRVKVTRIADVLQATGNPCLTLTLLGVERLLRYWTDSFPVGLQRMHDGLVKHCFIIGYACDILGLR